MLNSKVFSQKIWAAAFVLSLVTGFGGQLIVSREAFALENSKIVVDQLRFDSMKEYVQSEYFHKSGKRCGARRIATSVDLRLQKAVSDCTSYLTVIQNEYWPNEIYTIPVWWHVIYKSDNTGNISNTTIAEQMEALNEDYRAIAGTMGSNGYDVKIQFELAGITRTQNDEWFTDSSADEFAYKTALGEDQSKYLNIYTNDADGYLGYSYYPQDNPGVLDGIVLLYEAVGGRNNGFVPYEQGRTLVHEVGHYLGLAHTFDGGTCSNTYSTGDLVIDTNAENVDHYGCSQTYTCGTADPIHNYMNYTDDTCMYQFTKEQANRAVCSLVNYRPNILGGGVSVPPFVLPLLLQK